MTGEKSRSFINKIKQVVKVQILQPKDRFLKAIIPIQLHHLVTLVKLQKCLKSQRKLA